MDTSVTLKENLSELQDFEIVRTVQTQYIEFVLDTLVKKIQKGIIKLNPDYQRNHTLDNQDSSKLIETLILNIPIPTIYLSQDVDVDEEVEDGVSRYSVIDGQQRLTTVSLLLLAMYNLISARVVITQDDSLGKQIYEELLD